MDRTSNSAFNYCSNFIIFMKCGLLGKVPGKHQHIMGFRDKMKRNAFF